MQKVAEATAEGDAIRCVSVKEFPQAREHRSQSYKRQKPPKSSVVKHMHPILST